MGGANMTGSVKWYNASKGFGFILPTAGGGDVYFKGTDVTGPVLAEGEMVKYSVTYVGSKLQAMDVSRLDAQPQLAHFGGFQAPQQQQMPAMNAYAAAQQQQQQQQAFGAYQPNPYAQQQQQQQQQVYGAYNPYAGVGTQQAFSPMGQSAYSAASASSAAEGGETTGTVKWYNAEKGFGFILTGGGDIYFKGQDVTGAELQAGEHVKYSVIKMGSSKLQATAVSRAVGGVKRKMETAGAFD